MDHDQLAQTRASNVGLRELAELLGIGYDAARARLVEHKWPHDRRGKRRKGGYVFRPEHVERIRQIETVNAGRVGAPSTSGRTPRSQARAGVA